MRIFRDERALQETGTLKGALPKNRTVFLEQISVSQCPETRNCF